MRQDHDGLVSMTTTMPALTVCLGPYQALLNLASPCAACACCCCVSCRHNETFVPVCLPNFQPNAFVHAYVNCLDEVPHTQQAQQPLGPELSSQPQQPLTQPGPIQQQLQQQQQLHGSGSSSSSRGRGTFLMLLSGSADAFHKLSAAQSSFVGSVTEGPGGGVLARVQAAAVQPGCGRVRVEALPAPLGE